LTTRSTYRDGRKQRRELSGRRWSFTFLNCGRHIFGGREWGFIILFVTVLCLREVEVMTEFSFPCSFS
jgi:hypothetical protein